MFADTNRTIIEYHNVKYIGGGSDALSIVRKSEFSFTYVEGYIKLKPSNKRFRHSWAFDPNHEVVYEARLHEFSKDVARGETIPWDKVEYHGYVVTEEEVKKEEYEMNRTGRTFVLLDSDIDPIWKKITEHLG